MIGATSVTYVSAVGDGVGAGVGEAAAPPVSDVEGVG
jgi:hypothetical protein